MNLPLIIHHLAFATMFSTIATICFFWLQQRDNPELKGKLNGVAVRVPLLNASLTDCVFEVSRQTNVEEVNALLKEASETYLKGILGYETRPLVSSDYVNDPRSSIVDAPSTMVRSPTGDS